MSAAPRSSSIARMSRRLIARRASLPFRPISVSCNPHHTATPRTSLLVSNFFPCFTLVITYFDSTRSPNYRTQTFTYFPVEISDRSGDSRPRRLYGQAARRAEGKKSSSRRARLLGQLSLGNTSCASLVLRTIISPLQLANFSRHRDPLNRPRAPLNRR